MDEFLEFMKPISILFVVITVVVLLALGLLTYFEKEVLCPKFGNAVERPYRYSVFGGGCFVQDKGGRWVQKDNYWNSPQTND